MRLVLVLLAGCVVTRGPSIDERPRWRLADDGKLDAGCLSARAMVRKSGKQGIGIAVQLRSHGDCAVRFTGARLELAGASLPIATPPSLDLAGRSQLYAWWPVAFDNNAAWNDGRATAALVVDYAVPGATGSWRIAMEQR